MKSIFTRFFMAFVLLVTLGAGCNPFTMGYERQIQPPVLLQQALSTAPADATVDPYEGWGTIEPGGVISLRIPPGCKGDGAAGSTYVFCPTPDNDQPIPDMQISSDGIQVNIRRWEALEWDQRDKVIASLKVLTPLDRDIQINIEK